MAKRKRQVGRPSLGGYATTVRLTDDLRDRIRARVAGERDMAKYIREAIEEKLERDERSVSAASTR